MGARAARRRGATLAAARRPLRILGLDGEAGADGVLGPGVDVEGALGRTNVATPVTGVVSTLGGSTVGGSTLGGSTVGGTAEGWW
jgi:hypothetical protein